MLENRATSKTHMLEEVVKGLRETPKTLPSKYFYDKRGSHLFEQITQLEEYYPTRIENRILTQNIDEIIQVLGHNILLVEPGSGSSKKTRMLLDHLRDLVAYVPVEISNEFLNSEVRQLVQEYPDLLIKPVHADFTRPFEIPFIEKEYSRMVIFYPGSTIGNFHPDQARQFLSGLHRMLRSDGGILIGVDLKKNKTILEAAYNDNKGITADFNLNILRHINHALDANFNLNQFHHRAFYAESKGRMEMHLVSDVDQQITIEGEVIRFKKGESIHTENSYKYSLEEFEKLVEQWFKVDQIWTDERSFFSIQYLKKI